MATKPTVKMRALLARMDWDDDTVPFVAGAIDAGTFDVIGEEEWNELTKRWKDYFDPGAHIVYEWREVWITVPADKLKQVFEPKPIAAEVET